MLILVIRCSRLEALFRPTTQNGVLSKNINGPQCDRIFETFYSQHNRIDNCVTHNLTAHASQIRENIVNSIVNKVVKRKHGFSVQ